ncbi:unnamed protein product [Arctogadus glacialis]
MRKRVSVEEDNRETFAIQTQSYQVNNDVSQMSDPTSSMRQMPQPSYTLRMRVFFPVPEESCTDRGEQVTCPSREYKSHRPDVGLHLENLKAFVAFPTFLLDVVEEDNRGA